MGNPERWAAKPTLPVSSTAATAASAKELETAKRQLGTAANSSSWVSRHLIDPNTSKHMWKWDVCSSIALIFVALVTPVEVGFLEPAESYTDPLFLVNQVVNLIFLLDLVLQFFLKVAITDIMGTRIVSDPLVIAQHYARGWLLIDFLSIAVSAVDYVGIAAGTTASSNLDNLRTLRVLRALRLIKLSKLLTGQRIIKRWETKVAINYAAVSLLKCLIGMLLLSHFFACIWGMQAGFQDDKMSTWLGAFELCVINADGQEACKGAGYQYSAAIYWAVMTMTSIGFGDISASPGNIAEQIVCTVIMTLGAIGWGMVLGTIVGNLSNLDPEGDQFSSTMSELNKMMAREDLHGDLQIR
jgi:hypothetical protein